MKIPTSVQILGRWIKILYKDDLIEGGEQFHGFYSSEKKTIFIEKNQSDEEIVKTLIHEMVHCIVDLSSHSETFTQKQEETLCRLIENFSDLFYLKPVSNKIRYRSKK